MAEEFDAKLGIEIDFSKLEKLKKDISEIKALSLINLEIKVDNNLSSQLKVVQNQIKNISNVDVNVGSKRINNTGLKGQREEAERINEAYREMVELLNRVGDLSNRRRTPNNSSLIDADIERRMNKYIKVYSEYEKLLSNKQKSNLNNLVSKYSDRDALNRMNISSANAKALNTINDKAAGTYATQISALQERYVKLGAASETVNVNLSEMKSLLSTMRGSNFSEASAAQEKFKVKIQQTIAEIKKLQAANRESAAAGNLATKKSNLQYQVDSWLKQNSGAANNFKSQMEQIKAQLSSADSVKLSGLQAQFKAVANEAKIAGQNTQSFGDKLKNQFSKLSVYFSAVTVFQKTSEALRSMYDNVVKIDSAMTELKKVTNETDEGYANFLNGDAKTKSAEISSNISDYISSTADFARLGYSDLGQAQNLAKVANVYYNVGDGLENIGQASSNIISTMQAFNIEADDAMSIADKFNEVSNNFAISSGGIGDAMAKSASSLMASGNTIDEAIALITAANTTTQNPEIVGTALKTLTMRIRGAKSELEAEGGDTDGMANSVSKLREEIKALSGVDIMLDDNNFKSTYQILQELSKVWGNLSDITQANITELIAGKRQGDIMSSLMNNFSVAERAVTVSSGSAGSAMKELGTWQESLEAKTQELDNAWQSLSMTFLNTDFLKGGIEGITGFVKILDKLISSLGAIPTLAGAVAAALSFKNVGFFKLVDKEGTLSGKGFNFSLSGLFDLLFNKKVEKFSFSQDYLKQLAKDKEYISAYANEIINANSSMEDAYNNHMLGASDSARNFVKSFNVSDITADNPIESIFEKQSNNSEITNKAMDKSLKNVKSLINEYNRLAKAGENTSDFANAVTQGNKALGNTMTSANGASVSMGQYVGSLVKAKAATIGMQVASMALNTALSMGVSFAISSVIEGIASIKQAKQQKQDKIIDIGEKAGQDATNIIDLYNTYKTADAAYKSNTGSKENLTNATDALLAALGVEKSEISGLVKEYGNLDNVLNNVTQKSLEKKAKELESGISTKKEKAKDDLTESDWFFGDDTDSFGAMYISENPDSKTEDILNRHGFYAMSNYGHGISPIKGIGVSGLLTDAVRSFSGKGYSITSDQYNGDAEGVYAAYLALKKVREEMQDTFTRDELSDNAAYKEILVTLSKAEELYDGIDADAKTLNQIRAAQDYIQYLGKHGNVIPKTQEQFESMFNTIIDESKESDKYYGSFEDRTNAIYEQLKSMPDLSKFDFDTVLKDDENNIKNSFADKIKQYTKETTDDIFSDINKQFIEAAEGKPIDGNTFAKQSEENANKILDARKQGIVKAFKESRMADSNIPEALSNEFNDWVQTLNGNGMDILDQLVVKFPEAGTWTIDRWKDEFYKLKDSTDKADTSMQSFYATMNDTADGSLSSAMTAASEEITSLTDLYSKVDSGSLTDSEKLEMSLKYPKLAPYINDTNALKNAISDLIETSNQGINDQIEQQIRDAGLEGTEAAEAFRLLSGMVDELANKGTDFNIDVEIEKLNNLYSAMKNSVSPTGLTDTDIEKVNSMFSGFRGYNPSKLFEMTAHGIHLNTKELRGLQTEYTKIKKGELENDLNGLRQEYQALSFMINQASDASVRASLTDKQNSLRDRIQEVAQTAAEYDGLTSAYNRWILAQQNGSEHDMYDTIISGKDAIEDLIQRGWGGSDEVRNYVDLLSAEDLSNATEEEVAAAYAALSNEIGSSGYNIWDLFTKDANGKTTAQGAERFVDILKSEFGNRYVWEDESGNLQFDLGLGDDEEIAHKLGMDIETVQILLRALDDAGYDIHLDNANSALDELMSKADKAAATLRELQSTKGFEVPEFNFTSTDIDDINSQIQSAQKILDTFKDKDGVVDLKVEGASEAQTVLGVLIRQKQYLTMPAIMNVDVSNPTSEAEEHLKSLQEMLNGIWDYDYSVNITADTSEAEQKIRNIAANISNMPEPTVKALGLDTQDFQTALSNIKNVKVGAKLNPADVAVIKSSLDSITPEMMIKAGVDKQAIDSLDKDGELDKNSTVVYTVDDKEIQEYVPQPKIGSVVYTAQMNWDSYMNLPTTKTGTITYISKMANATNASASSIVSAAKKASGEATGTAFARGNWGTPSSGTALGGELGQEIVVSKNGRYRTIGDNGAEFFQYQKGDIIFSAEQSKQLFKYGKIIRGKKRGKIYAEGAAFSGGTSSNAWDKFKSYSSNSSKSSSSSSSNSSNKSNSSNNSSSSSASEESKEFKDTLDWIEIAIKRVEKAINKLDSSATSVYRNWQKRNTSLLSEMKKTTEQISLQESAYKEYLKKANSISLSAEYKKKVREGKISIEDIKDEELSNNIKDYQTWYDKAVEAKDSTDDLRESLSKLSSTSIENISTQFDAVFSRIDYWKNMTEETLNQAEERGRIANQRYYKTLAGKEQYRIKELEAERVKLVNALNKAVSSGAIARGSEEWNKLSDKINNVTLEIKKSNTELLKYKNNIRDIDWKISENVIDQMSQITREADFIINLLSSDKLYEDSGQFTDKGLSTMGMHFADHNVYMEQAKSYGKQLLEINRQIADDPKNQTLIDKKNELVKAQQEVILSAKSEKDAIKDMVKTGIEKELDALKKLIDKYEEAVESQKDLYDYQNKVKDRTSEISSLQKQLKAYEGDDSEETKATIQKLRTSLNEAQRSLEETQYDKYVSDQKELLDKFYDDYEETLNKRLDDIDRLMLDMRDVINSGTQNICNTVTESVTNAAYTLSENMSRLLTSHSVSGLVSYNTNESEGNTSENLTSIQNVLSTIKEDTYNMVKLANISVRDAAAIARAIANGTDTSTLPKYYDYNGDGEINVRDSAAIANYLAGLTEELKTNGYASGVHEVSKSQYAWTQEKGREFIVRRSDGAVLTPLAKGDSVLTAEASVNIWNMANNPTEFIRDNLRLNNIDEKPVVNSNIGGVSVGDVSLNLSLPNVTNYKEFVYQMQHDSSFEKMVQAMTIDKMFGKSSLRKYKM